MTVTSINASSVSWSFSADSVASAPSDVTTSSGTVSGHHRHHRSEGQFRQAVQQALSQSGVNLPTGNSNTTSGAQDTDGDNDSTQGTSSVRQDMHQLMHDLFSALRQAQSGDTGGTDGDSDGGSGSAIQGKYSSMDNALQGLIQQLGSGASTPAGPLSALQADFQKLLTDVQSQQGTSGTNTSAATTPTLQSFLEDLLKNLGEPTLSSAAVGGSVNTKS